MRAHACHRAQEEFSHLALVVLGQHDASCSQSLSPLTNHLQAQNSARLNPHHDRLGPQCVALEPTAIHGQPFGADAATGPSPDYPDQRAEKGIYLPNGVAVCCKVHNLHGVGKLEGIQYGDEALCYELLCVLHLRLHITAQVTQGLPSKTQHWLVPDHHQLHYAAMHS